VVWVVADKTVKGSETGTSFKQALYFKEIGFNLYDTMIYASDAPPRNSRRYEPKFEYMFVLSKGIPKTFNPIMEPCTYAGRTQNARSFRKQDGELRDGQKGHVKEFKVKGNIWYIPNGYNKSTLDKIAFEHPAIFPERLAEDHIISWSKVNDIVLDCFCGSGTVPKMALQNLRNYIGIDISQEYIDLSQKRLNIDMDAFLTEYREK
jgi:site-specific DNA-methyltransferase (adenine-specific)